MSKREVSPEDQRLIEDAAERLYRMGKPVDPEPTVVTPLGLIRTPGPVDPGLLEQLLERIQRDILEDRGITEGQGNT